MRRITIILSALLIALGLLVLEPGWLGFDHTQVAHAQGKKGRKKSGSKKSADQSAKSGGKANKKLKVFDFTGLDVSGQLRAPQLLYFLDRANEELQRASLERRSFIPELVRSIDEESL